MLPGFGTKVAELSSVQGTNAAERCTDGNCVRVCVIPTVCIQQHFNYTIINYIVNQLQT